MAPSAAGATNATCTSTRTTAAAAVADVDVDAPAPVPLPPPPPAAAAAVSPVTTHAVAPSLALPSSTSAARHPPSSLLPDHLYPLQPSQPHLRHLAHPDIDPADQFEPIPQHQQHQHQQPQRDLQHSASPSRRPRFVEEWDASVRGSSIVNGHFAPSASSSSPTNSHPPPQPRPLSRPHRLQKRPYNDDNDNSNSAAAAAAAAPTFEMQRSSSVASHRSDAVTSDAASGRAISLSRGNTLKKKNSLRRSGSLKRSSSRRSMKAGSVRSLALQAQPDANELASVFYCPVPTSGNPTEVLSARFQSWRKVLKDLIAYFREIQSHYEQRAKSLLKLANVANNTSTPPGFLTSGGLDDALHILRNHHKSAILEANKAREIEEDVILALTGLRSDLNQKMKEIKSLTGDFKNSVEKEMDGTRRAVNSLQDVLGQNELDTSLTTGKQDPYLLRLTVDRQVERQLDEENYLHQAYLNLETSGRELESIVVGEIQKAYNAYAGILKREADAAYNTIDELRVGPIAMPKDHEWSSFIARDSQFVDPDMPIRSAEHIHYPGRDHFACQEIRAGLLERKSKYLKSYTAGWYVLSPTHLHEFKSADKTQAPVMSLYLPEQKLGSHSVEGGSSNKFILKGRQTGTMHRGHTWVFRAESHDTMMAWYEDIQALTDKSPEEVSNFVRGHVRSLSRTSQRSISSDGAVDDEDDEQPFAPNAAVVTSGPRDTQHTNRPEPGGRFPSDLEVTAQRGLQVPLSPSSNSSAQLNQEYNTNGYQDHDVIAAVVNQPGSSVGEHSYPNHRLSVGQSYGNTPSIRMGEAPSHGAMHNHQAQQDGVNPYTGELTNLQRNGSNRLSFVAGQDTVLPTRGRQPSQDSVGLSSSNPSTYDGKYAMDGQQMYAPTSGPASHQIKGPLAGNGFAKAAPPVGGIPDGPVYVTQDGQVRPANPRTNSTPHVPGEFPRSSVGGTPGAY